MFVSDSADIKRYKTTAIYIAAAIVAVCIVALMCVNAAKALVSAHNEAVASMTPQITETEEISESEVPSKKLPVLGLGGAVVDESEPIDIRIPRCENIHLSLAEKTCDFSFTNPESNECYLRVAITRHDTNETVFTSSLISPGKTLDKITLTTSFSHFASYEAMVKVDAYSLTGLSFLNSLIMDAVIYTY